MRINKLWLKMALVSAAAAVIAVIAVALLVRNATSTDFGKYLQLVGRMNQMMGRNSGMMGPSETSYLNAVNNSLWIAALIAVFLAVIVAFIFSRQITAPLSRLSVAAGKVARGDLSCRVKSTSGDEVGALSANFNCMVESLNNNQEMRRKLMADVAHEMGTPLAVIQSNLEGILDGVVEPNPASIGSLHQETLVLSRLVKDLRTLSLVESGHLNLAPAPADLGALAGDIVQATGAEALAKHVALHLNIEPGLPLAFIDRDRVSQIITNLLSNALRYTAENDAITVSVSHEPASEANQNLLVAVADTGQGIEPGDLAHLFERYFQGSNSREKRAGGSGIGLTVVRDLVEAHHGRVWVNSTPGKGSTFYFTLPAATPALKGNLNLKSRDKEIKT